MKNEVECVWICKGIFYLKKTIWKKFGKTLKDLRGCIKFLI